MAQMNKSVIVKDKDHLIFYSQYFGCEYYVVGYQMPWYWTSYPRSFRFQQQKGWFKLTIMYFLILTMDRL